MFKTISKTAILLALTLVASSTAFAGGSYDKPKDIVDTAVANGSFKTLAAALST